MGIMKSIGTIARCSQLFQEDQLKHLSIRKYQYIYIINICRSPGLSQEELSRIIYVNKSNVARQLSDLEEKGFVYRKADRQDKRMLSVYPTEHALEIYPEIMGVFAKWKKELTEDFSEKDIEDVCIILERLADKAKEKAEKNL